VDDLADAVVFLMNRYEGLEHINIGTGEDVTILELAEIIKEIVGYSGKIKFDATKPDGTMRKLLDVSKLTQLGWKYGVNLGEGIKISYEHFLRKGL